MVRNVPPPKMMRGLFSEAMGCPAFDGGKDRAGISNSPQSEVRGLGTEILGSQEASGGFHKWGTRGGSLDGLFHGKSN